jgi:xylulose-5-phosphate/fructose-6-phosphate phosphoketolase
MPGEIIDHPNPEAMPSQIPDEVLQLAVRRKPAPLDEKVLDHFVRFENAANYITAAMIFLRDNVLLSRPLEFNDIKPRLLGNFASPSTYAFIAKPFQAIGVPVRDSRWSTLT